MRRSPFRLRTSTIALASAALAFASVLPAGAVPRGQRASARRNATTHAAAVSQAPKAVTDEQALELLRLVVRDVHENPETTVLVGHDVVEIRRPPHFEWSDFDYDPETDGDVEVRSVAAVRFRGERRDLVALTFELDVASSGERGIIALVDGSTPPKLLDVLDVTADQHTSFVEHRIEIAAGDEAIEVDNWHDNSSESYDNFVLVGVVGGALRVVIDGPGFRSFATFDERRNRLCKTALSYELRPLPASHFRFRDLALDVTELRVCHDNDAGNWDWKTGIVGRVRTRQVWRWNPRTRAYRRVATRPAPQSHGR